MKITCLSIDCPERKSVCCGARSKAVNGKKEPYFVCSACGKLYKGGECTAISEIEDWEEVFDMFYDDNEAGGSSRWLVAPTNVKVFIKGLVAGTRFKENEKANKACENQVLKQYEEGYKKGYIDANLDRKG